MTMPSSVERIIYSGRCLRELREEAGFSAEDLGRLVGSTSETIRQWESGRYTPPARKLGRLAEVLHCTPSDFFVTRDLSTE